MKCVQCGNTFVRVNKQQRYCSKECKARHDASTRPYRRRANVDRNLAVVKHREQAAPYYRPLAETLWAERKPMSEPFVPATPLKPKKKRIIIRIEVEPVKPRVYHSYAAAERRLNSLKRRGCWPGMEGYARLSLKK